MLSLACWDSSSATILLFSRALYSQPLFPFLVGNSDASQSGIGIIDIRAAFQGRRMNVDLEQYLRNGKKSEANIESTVGETKFCQGL